jgi:uncharacterized membrane protein YphA (DoxX/SURF4 family)
MKKRDKIIYWIATLWLSLGMVATGIGQILKQNGQGGIDMIEHLGFPVYLLPFLGICKLLGVIVLLIPKSPVVKEWAYAGFAFLMMGAIYSHISAHDGIVEILPGLLLLVLTIVSWYFRPRNRKVILNSTV